MQRVMAFVAGCALLVVPAHVCDAGVIFEVEPNNSLATAQSIDGHFTLDYRADIGNGDYVTNTSTTIPHVTIVGSGNGTYDYYSFTLDTTTPRFMVVDVDYTTGGLDSHVAIWAEDGTLLGHNDDYDHQGGAGGSVSDLDSLHTLYLMSSGTYYVGVARASANPDVGGFSGNAPEAGQSYYLHVSVEGQPVPEPSTLALMGVGVMLVASWRWQTRKRAKAM